LRPATCSSRIGRCRNNNPELARDLLKQAGYKGDAIPYFLLNNYYTNQTATGQVVTEMWQQVGLNVEIQMKENWSQVFAGEGERGIRDWSCIEHDQRSGHADGDPVSAPMARRSRTRSSRARS
jgi:peptide/nickel transport system substrate-binding protein